MEIRNMFKRIKKFIKGCEIGFKLTKNKLDNGLIILCVFSFLTVIMIGVAVLINISLEFLKTIEFEKVASWIDGSSIILIFNNLFSGIQDENTRILVSDIGIPAIFCFITTFAILSFKKRKGRIKFYLTWLAYISAYIINIILWSLIVVISTYSSEFDNIVTILAVKLFLDVFHLIVLLNEFIHEFRYVVMKRYLIYSGIKYLTYLPILFLKGDELNWMLVFYAICLLIELGFIIYYLWGINFKNSTTKTNETYGTISISDFNEIFGHHYIERDDTGFIGSNKFQNRTIFVDLSSIKTETDILSFDTAEDCCLSTDADKKRGFYLTIILNKKSHKGRHYVFFDKIDKAKNKTYSYCYVLSLRWCEGEVTISKDKLAQISVHNKIKKEKSVCKKEYKDYFHAISGSILSFQLTQFKKNNSLAIKHKALQSDVDKLRAADDSYVTNTVNEIVLEINNKKEEIRKIRQTGALKITENGIKLEKTEDNDPRTCVLLDQKYGTGKTLGCIIGVSELGFRPLIVSFWKDRITKGYIFSLFKCCMSNEGETLGRRVGCWIMFYYYKQKALFKNLHLSIYLVVICASMVIFNSNFFNIGIELNIVFSILIASALMPYIMLLKREESFADMDYYMYLIVKLMKIKNIVFIMEDIDRSSSEQVDASFRIISSLSDEIYRNNNFSQCRIIISLDTEEKVIQKHINEIDKIVYYNYKSEEDNTIRYVEELKKYISKAYGDQVAKKFENECDEIREKLTLRIAKKMFRDYIEHCELETGSNADGYEQRNK